MTLAVYCTVPWRIQTASGGDCHVHCGKIQEQTHQILPLINHTCLSSGACQARGDLRDKLAAAKVLNCLPPPGNFIHLAKDYPQKRKKRTHERLKNNGTVHHPILTDEHSLNIKY